MESKEKGFSLIQRVPCDVALTEQRESQIDVYVSLKGYLRMIEEYDNDGFRSYGGIDDGALDKISANKQKTNVKSDLNVDRELNLKHLRDSIIGTYEIFTGPYGERPLVYCDWTASGKCVSKVENYIAENVIPLYGNTHTTTSITGHQTTCFRHEARQIVAEACNAKVTGRAAEDVVIFTGNGTTAAINKLVLSLGLNTPLPKGYDDSHRPIVFTSCYEHHSNLLSWRESVAEVITVQYSPSTGVCLLDLSRLLKLYSKRTLKIGAFSAASNVTGVLTCTNSLSCLMHKAGGLVFFDYATAAPYVKMDMNPVSLGADASYMYKDAIIFSGHKFIGGPGCPGVLIVKRAILPAQNSLPCEPGGGTVFYVTENNHRYLTNREEREEGGTPDILADVKLGLVVALKQSFNVQWIEQEELKISQYAQTKLQQNKKILLLGRLGGWIQPGTNIRHLPIFSFLIRRGSRFLHHNFVCALLNDLFGVQSRGGCQCAGPFSQHILGIYIYIYAYTCLCVCVYVYTFIFAHIMSIYKAIVKINISIYLNSHLFLIYLY
jgi:selenocysteine lyase/cysteine desulfurase